MSIEATCTTQIKDREALVEALREIYGKSAIRIANQGEEIKGYRSGRKPEVVINIPNLIGTAGFCKAKNGNWELVFDSSDRSRLKQVMPQKGKNGTVDLLTQTYAKHQVKKAMKSLRGRFVKDEVEADGSIRMKVKLTSY